MDSTATAGARPSDLQRLLAGRHHDPFELLGVHPVAGEWVVRALLPGAQEARLALVGASLPMQRWRDTDLFIARIRDDETAPSYRLRWRDAGQTWHEREDPYRFSPVLQEFDLHLFGEGRHVHAYRILGAHCCEHEGVAGVRFAVWAPNARRVSVVGDFNDWNGQGYPMRIRGGSGVWELFLPEIAAGSRYKYEVLGPANQLCMKADPYGNRFEVRPANASVIEAPSSFTWQDEAWLQARADRDWRHEPMSVYEVHLGSWQRAADGSFLGYRDLAERLVEHVERLGFTHVELLPILEHPFDGSWGYQCTGYFAPTSRFGSPDDFRYLVDRLHRAGIGVLLDWVPAHFPRDEHALARFDGTALYEHEDPRQGEHRDWGTLIFNYGRNEVRNFLLASANYWLEEFHLDGLRVDAVASMLYLDYSRDPGEWAPNRYGGNENLEAIEFLRELNSLTHGRHPGTLMIAEESTAWPQVTRPVWVGGLGFSMKWNMGWMHDTLAYLAQDPIHRQYHHDQLTFGLLYAFSENFLLPFSHDEVVHEKRALLEKMPGDEWQRYANLRLLYTYQYTYPGTKLLFMGAELGQREEWQHDHELPWHNLEALPNRHLLQLLGDLNRLYRSDTSLHRGDFQAAGFEWIDCHDSAQSVISYLRRDGDRYLAVVLNFTPVVRRVYRIGVPVDGAWREVFNSDALEYGGSGVGNGSSCFAEAVPWMDRPASITLTLPPLAGLILRPGD